MATSGVFTYNPEIADLLREAFERVLIKPSDIGYDKIESGIRSMNLLLQEWSNRGFKGYEMVQVNQTLSTQGAASFTLPASVLRIFTAVLRRSSIDTPLVMISREDYEAIPAKTTQGRPTELFLDAGVSGLTVRTVYVWPTPENTTDVVRMWCLRRPEAITSIAQEPGISSEWTDAFAAGVAVRLARKYAPKLVADLHEEAQSAFNLARDADRDRSPLRLRMSTRGRRGWR